MIDDTNTQRGDALEASTRGSARATPPRHLGALRLLLAAVALTAASCAPPPESAGGPAAKLSRETLDKIERAERRISSLQARTHEMQRSLADLRDLAEATASDATRLREDLGSESDRTDFAALDARVSELESSVAGLAELVPETAETLVEHIQRLDSGWTNQTFVTRALSDRIKALEDGDR